GARKGLFGNGGRGGATAISGAAADELSRPRRYPRRRAKRLSRGAGPRGVALPARSQRIRSGEDGGADARLAIELAADRAARRRTQRAQDARGAASSRGLVTLNRR